MLRAKSSWLQVAHARLLGRLEHWAGVPSLLPDELEAEGVEVRVGRTGEFLVDLKTWGWFPDPAQVDLEDGAA